MYTLKVKVTQSSPTLCHPMDNIVNGILQARTLEWVAFAFSRGSSQPRDQTRVSCSAGGFFVKPSSLLSKMNMTNLRKTYEIPVVMRKGAKGKVLVAP